jgi:hypothetical protein
VLNPVAGALTAAALQTVAADGLPRSTTTWLQACQQITATAAPAPTSAGPGESLAAILWPRVTLSGRKPYGLRRCGSQDEEEGEGKPFVDEEPVEA